MVPPPQNNMSAKKSTLCPENVLCEKEPPKRKLPVSRTVSPRFSLWKWNEQKNGKHRRKRKKEETKKRKETEKPEKTERNRTNARKIGKNWNQRKQGSNGKKRKIGNDTVFRRPLLRDLDTTAMKLLRGLHRPLWKHYLPNSKTLKSASVSVSVGVPKSGTISSWEIWSRQR